MQSKKGRWILSVLLLVVFSPNIAPRLVHPITRMFLEDFHVYYTAAILAHQHKGSLIYEGADTGLDPQLREAPTNGIFAQTAYSIGIPRLELYVYPPTLADCLIPLTLVSRSTAEKIWILLNFLELIISAFCIIALFRIPLLSWQCGILLLCIYISSPVQSCLAWGQVTILLLLLWASATVLYSRGWVISSAILFALASALKLTPCIVFFPFLLWRDWRWIQAFLATIAIIMIAICLINSPETLLDYFRHVVPAMSHGIALPANMSVASAIQLIWSGLHGSFNSNVKVANVPQSVQTVAKIISMVVLLCGLLYLIALRHVTRPEQRTIVLAMLALLAVATSPVSWLHAYTIIIPALTILWVDAYRVEKTWPHILALTLCTSALMTKVLSTFVVYLYTNHPNQHLLLIMLSLVGPCAAIILVCMCFQTALKNRFNSSPLNE